MTKTVFALSVVLLAAGPFAAQTPAPSGRAIHEQLEQAGVRHVYYEAPGTAHEFQTWRKSLHGFAQLLFPAK